MKVKFYFLLAVIIFSTEVAQTTYANTNLNIPLNATHAEVLEWALATNEPANKSSYEGLLQAYPKLHLNAPLDMTLPQGKYPYTDWVTANQTDVHRYSSIARWLNGTTKLKIKCLIGQKFDEESNSIKNKREANSRSIRSSLRNFDTSEYVKDVPGFTDCGLDEAEYDAIFDYTEEIYQKLNPDLRAQRLSIQETDFTSTLIHGLDKIDDFNGWVLRGDNLTDERKSQYVVGAVIQNSAFLSTSLQSGFGGNGQFQIRSLTGKYIAPLSATHGEEEVLFKPGTKFKITDVKPDEKNPTITHYIMEEIIP